MSDTGGAARAEAGLFADRLRVLVVAAHPDEPDEYVGGTAARLAQAGHGVKFLSLTNGDAGHWATPRKALARRRAAEAFAAARELGVQEYEILDAHDGELTASIEMRRKVVSRIRRWQADVVVTFHDECPAIWTTARPGAWCARRSPSSGWGTSFPGSPRWRWSPCACSCRTMTRSRTTGTTWSWT